MMEVRETGKVAQMLALEETKEMDVAARRLAVEDTRETTDVVVVIPHHVLLGEGVGYRLWVAPLAAVEGRAEGGLSAEVVPVDVVAVAPLCTPGSTDCPCRR